MTSFKRDEALRAAEKAIKANKLDVAIAEYARVVEHQPRDFTTANALGDLYARVGQTDKAIAQYARIAEQFMADGFLPKASALFKKILKIRPNDEGAQLRLGQMAAAQGLLADARAILSAVEGQRRARGDAWGADDILLEMAGVEGADLDARMQGARVLAARGQSDAAAGQLRDLAVDLLEKERPQEAIDVLREAVHLVPGDRLARRQLIGLLTDLDQAAEAEVYLTRDVAAGDPVMLLALAKAEIETGRLEEGREDLRAALEHAGAFTDVMAFMRRIAPRQPDAAGLVADALAEAALAAGQVEQAIDALRACLECAPAQVGCAARLVEVCLEEGLADQVPVAQAALADAYVAAGQPEAAKRIRDGLDEADPFAERKKGQRAEGTGDVRDEGGSGKGEGGRLWDEGRALELDVPEFEVYVYGQPIESTERSERVESLEPVESEEQLIARLLAEEAARDEQPATEAVPEIDLTKTLDELDAEPAADAPAAALEDVFEGFRERTRVEEHERAEAAFEEAELAAALGQVADAERLYAEASRAAPFRFRAAAALGRVLAGEGRLADAIEWFERATEVPAPDRDAGHVLFYDLGDALERKGETMRALAIFMELHADAGRYRDVAARVERLARAEIGG